MRRSTHSTLDDALHELQAETAEAASRPPAKEIDVKIRYYRPEDLVRMRAQLRGPQRFVPQVRCGIDVRGDGSLEPWIGGAERHDVKLQSGENAWQALRRELAKR
ncbi:MAG: hypothetical protein NT122_00915 [Solirubrobacterales bacterium]|nr:hypothetical protein [Solirubrobacterales bacterium]